jgi:hypothetical protein
VSASPSPSAPLTPSLERDSSRRRAWAGVVRDVASDGIDRAVFMTSAVLVAFSYSLLLPFAFTQRISFANWRYLDARYIIFTFVFALGIAWLLTLQIHAVRRIARPTTGERAAGRTGPLGFLAAVISVLPSLLCCSPVLPTVVGLVGLSASTRLATTVSLQHFFATKENLLLGGALALLLASVLWSMRKLGNVACLSDECCPAPITNPQNARTANGHTKHPTVIGAVAGGATEPER